jgi:hypothetical protein
MYKRNLKLVIKYLEGEIDIYNKDYINVVEFWEQVWDELSFMGYNPQNPNSIRKYIKEQL